MAEQPVLGFAGLLRQLRAQARLTQQALGAVICRRAARARSGSTAAAASSAAPAAMRTLCSRACRR
jgi:hypothetical protein